jgi:hypothetical protein
MAAGEEFASWADQEPQAQSQDASGLWTTYVLHFDRPYKHARHYTGNPESSGFLKVPHRCLGGGFDELPVVLRARPAPGGGS